MLQIKNPIRLSGGRDAALIATDYEVLHREQDPILFTGVNRFGARILGTFVDEDVDHKIDRFLHVQVPNGDYAEFLRGKLSYREIIQRSGTAYIVEQPFGNGSGIVVFAQDIDDVPHDYLPRENSLAPPASIDAGPEYAQKLEGGRAELHRAEPGDVSALLESFPLVLTQPLNDLNIGLSVRVEVLGFPAGSFEVHFAVRVVEDSLFSISVNCDEYLKRHLDFCLNHFPSEAKPVADNRLTFAPHFSELLDLRKVAVATMRPTVDMDVERLALVRSIEKATHALADISSVIGESLKSITVLNILNGGRSTVGIIDERSSPALNEALDLVEPLIGTKRDRSPQRYSLLIYMLNRQSRRGAGHIVDDPKRMPRARLQIADDLEFERFTEAFHRFCVIKVKGIATKDQAGNVHNLLVQSIV